METFRFAARLLRRAPAFTIATILILATGIGANTAMFSIVSAVLIEPLGFSEPEQLVAIGEVRPNAVGDKVSVPTFVAWRNGHRGVHVGAYSTGEQILAGAEPAVVTLASVSGNFFALLGEPVLLGRQFTPQDERAGAVRTAILSHALWQQRFAGDTAVLGRTLMLGSETFEVVGVARRGFNFPDESELWVPQSGLFDSEYARPTFAVHKNLSVIGRLRPDATIERVTAELSSIASSIPRNEGWSARVVPLRDTIVGDIRPALIVLMISVMLVLLIACANVGNLLLARGVARKQEVAIRAALGASRSRIARELLAESLLLAVAAGLLGVLIATWTLDMLVSLTPIRLPHFVEFGMDMRVLGFAVALSVLTGLLAGIIPAIRAGSVDLTPALKKSDRGSVRSGRPDSLRASLVIAEVALSVVLLAGAGLLIRSFLAIVSVDPGFRPDHVTAFEIALPRHKYTPSNPIQVWDVPRHLVERAQRIPGVVAAATTADLPISGREDAEPVVVEGQPRDPASPHARRSAVSPGYFRAMGIPFVSGRDFQDLETTGVVIVSESFARVFLPGTDPIGKRVSFAMGGRNLKEIVGVVGDVHHAGLTTTAEPVMYAPAGHSTYPNFTLVVRSSTPIERLGPAIRQVVREVDPDAPITSISAMRDIITRSVAQPRFYAVMLGGFAVLAVVLAMLGLYAVLSQSVAQRRQEIGIRMALGAAAEDILTMLLGQGLRLALIGAVIGLGGALATSRLLSRLLFGVAPNDATTLVATLGLILLAAIVAIMIPARRAARLDPMRSLRE